MIQVEFDGSDFIAEANKIGAVMDQMPYIMALALNNAAEVTRSVLIGATWPQHVKQRNSSFIAASLTTKGARATKQDLTVEIYDKLDRGNLLMQAKGGMRAPRGGSNLAVPSSAISRTASGVPQRFLPRNMPKALRKGDVLYTKDKKGKLTLMYVLRHQTPIPKRVPFYEDFAASMQKELTRSIPLAVARAMSTRKPR